jgi:hypothetical protein
MLPVLGVTAIGLQAGILVALAEGCRRRNAPAVVNASLSFLVAVLPLLVELVAGSSLGWSAESEVVLTLWIAAAGLLHSVGMLGLYESVDWWDHLTHTFSAALLAALVYAGMIVVAGQGGLPPVDWVGAVTVLFVLLAGVWWELVELFARDIGQRYGIEPVLVYYGVLDTALDLVFDLVGVLLIVLLDVRVFVPIAAGTPQATELLLFGVTGFLSVSTLLLAVLVRFVFD